MGSIFASGNHFFSFCVQADTGVGEYGGVAGNDLRLCLLFLNCFQLKIIPMPGK